MAYPTLVNSMITDAVTQSSLATLGQAPSMAMSTVYQSAAHSLSILYENAVQAQKHASISGQASTNQGVIQIYSVDTMAGAAGAAKLANSDVVDQAMALLAALAALKKK